MRTTLEDKHQGAAAVPPPHHHTPLQIRLTDFLTFVVVFPATKKMMLPLLWGLPDPQMVIQHVAGGGL